MDTDVVGCSGCGVGVSVSDTGGLCDVCFAGLPEGVWARPESLASLLIDAGENTIVSFGGWDWRYRTDQDETCDVSDFPDCYGRVALVTSCRWGSRQAERPDGFDGGAMIIHGWRGDRYWWQPPAGVSDVRKLAHTVSDLLCYGFVFVRVERLRPDDRDGYGEQIVDDYAIIGGIEWGTDENGLRDFIDDLIDGIGV